MKFKEARDRVVRDYGAVEGGKQTLERAAEYVAGMLSEPFVLAREFAAPRAVVWRCWLTSMTISACCRRSCAKSWAWVARSI